MDRADLISKYNKNLRIISILNQELLEYKEKYEEAQGLLNEIYHSPVYDIMMEAIEDE